MQILHDKITHNPLSIIFVMLLDINKEVYFLCHGCCFFCCRYWCSGWNELVLEVSIARVYHFSCLLFSNHKAFKQTKMWVMWKPLAMFLNNGAKPSIHALAKRSFLLTVIGTCTWPLRHISKPVKMLFWLLRHARWRGKSTLLRQEGWSTESRGFWINAFPWRSADYPHARAENVPWVTEEKPQ